MSLIFEIVIAFLLVVGGIFGFAGSFGLIKFRDPMSRLHTPTLATTLGVGGVLLGSMLHAWVFQGRFSLHEILIIMFLLIAPPLSAHFLAKLHIHLNERRESLPPPDVGADVTDWAVLDPKAGATGKEPGL
ncbi:Na+/H+ antiporter subunit G [Pontibaca methylaminivorans]|uniref:Na+/H+ antiporter subunit G n=1 Tax=Pontibaca methylaminivorans TaxID=515897 RepID=UPI002FD97867